ncbi:MFS transporter [Leuconostoc citreum]|jgi:MFS family permease|uniref:MFS transporter n=1 Tax=Leuconostoc citreum TaxID=33964 RepID=A0A5A5U1V4_LEUCI|nr:MFS transporter [Leuconostoc citreum]UVW16600.1 MFS transporter [Leuconostoc citreum]GDZ84359.1 MFS transporter [Leuconostoc citreum]
MSSSVQNSFLFKISILSISLVLTVTTAVSTALPAMIATFKQYPSTQVEMLTTLPTISLLLTVLASSWIIKRLGARRTTLIGLIIALLAGLVPVFINDYVIVFISRLLLGVGVGLFNNLAYSLIMAVYEGEERQTMLGFQSAVGTVGNALASFVVGLLISNGWQVAFNVNWLFVIPLVLFGLFATKIDQFTNPVVTETGDTVPIKAKETTNMAVVGYVLLIATFFAFYFGLLLKLAGFLVEQHLGTAAVAATQLSVMSLIGLLPSLLYGQIYKHLRRLTIPIGLIITGLGIGIIATAGTLTMTWIGIVISGFGLPIVMPAIFGKVAEVQPEGSSNLSSALMLVGINVAVFLSPQVLAVTTQIIGQTSNKATMLVSTVMLFVLGAIQLVMATTKKQPIKNRSEMKS